MLSSGSGQREYLARGVQLCSLLLLGGVLVNATADCAQQQPEHVAVAQHKQQHSLPYRQRPTKPPFQTLSTPLNCHSRLHLLPQGPAAARWHPIPLPLTRGTEACGPTRHKASARSYYNSTTLQASQLASLLVRLTQSQPAAAACIVPLTARHATAVFCIPGSAGWTQCLWWMRPEVVLTPKCTAGLEQPRANCFLCSLPLCCLKRAQGPSALWCE